MRDGVPDASDALRAHGGADARGAARWDFSTCANAAGPCPTALAAVQSADATRYPDPASTALRRALAALHDVPPARVLIAVSASEFIQRVTAVTARIRPGAVRVPRLAYGDYAHAARAWGRALHLDASAPDAAVTLAWHADPTSPLGENAAAAATPAPHPAVLDAVYAPLRLHGASAWTEAAKDAVFVLHSPNKALGLTGVRGAYAIAPARAAYDAQACCAALEAAAPSWPLSAQGEAMLLAWTTPEVQRWVQDSHAPLAAWKQSLQEGLRARGFRLWPSATNFFVAQPPRPLELQQLRAEGIALRDAASFGLAGQWRVSAQPPAAQAALWAALDRRLAPATKGGAP
ncbi:MAG TPA: aminotransferase class I/II-fold pyridoxal phosphate-dependent enzyme [Rubrivivax sp.]|nr:aminotransferase class I/II-fold pyridoxal phosphate-dependent enzyme [Burkholderiales bacterium]HNT39258.1 aminotransferase class I/II-fold pyridoxal phosphate-dependent enzyme [Rubrivivax sp.]